MLESDDDHNVDTPFWVAASSCRSKFRIIFLFQTLSLGNVFASRRGISDHSSFFVSELNWPALLVRIRMLYG